MGAYSISNTEFLSHDYDARGLDPQYRAVTKSGQPCDEWEASFEYAESVSEGIGGVVQKRFITEPKTITADPDDRHKLSAQMVLVEAMLAELPLVDWQGDRDYLQLGDKVFCCKEIDGMGTTSEIEVEVIWVELDESVLAPVFHEREHDEFHSPHQLLIEGWEFTLLAEDDND
nr:MAG TPA: hypothetical protein [Caudoviricetes sp.]